MGNPAVFTYVYILTPNRQYIVLVCLIISLGHVLIDHAFGEDITIVHGYCEGHRADDRDSRALHIEPLTLRGLKHP